MLKAFLLSTIFSYQINQSDTIQLINSNEVLEQSTVFIQNEEYNKAIHLLQSVHESDSNYIKVQTNLILALSSNDQFTEVEKIKRILLKRYVGLSSGFYVELGNAYLNNEYSSEAMGVYQKGLEEFPYNPTLLYNMGYVHDYNGNYNEAIRYFIQALKIDPFHSRSHQKLGLILAKSNYRSKAVLCFLTYLAINPDQNWALIRINDLMNDAYREEGSISLNLSNEHFEYYDNILKSKIALDDRYNTKVNFEAAVAQQSEFLINQMKYIEGTNDFWMEFYVPFLEKLSDNNLSDAFVYFILKSANKEGINKWLDQHKKEKDEWIGIANDYLGDNKYYNERSILDSTNIYRHWYHSNKVINAIGEESDGKNIGPYEFYYDNGRLNARGMYNAVGSKMGMWEYFHTNGRLSSIEDYGNDGETIGEIKSFDSDGKLKSIGDYKNGELHGNWETYYPCGTINEQFPYVNGIGDGAGTLYFNTGEIKIRYNIKDAKLDGEYKVFYKSGQLSKKMFYDLGKKEGLFESYSANGQIREKGSYLDNELDGEVKVYYSNSELDSERTYKNGKGVEEWVYSYSNGKRKRIEQYNYEGQLNDTTKWFDIDDKLHAYRIYKNGMLIGYSYFDKTGKILGQAFDENGNMDYSSYNPSGEIDEKSRLESGLMSGTTTTYHSNGLIKIESTMLEDYWHGEYKEYWNNGNLKKHATYNQGDLDGYYRAFYKSGKLKKEGWLIKNNIQQHWLEYYINGEVMSDYYYSNGELQGLCSQYNSFGKITLEEYFDRGVLTKFLEYDSLGTAYNVCDLQETGGELTMKYANGSIRKTTTINCGNEVKDILSLYANGQKSFEYTIVNAKKTNYKSYNESGMLTLEGDYLDGQKDGVWKYFHDNGNVEILLNYREGEQNGKGTYYYENGSTELEKNYLNDEKHGEMKFYDKESNLQLIKFYRKDFGAYAYTYEMNDGNYVDTIYLDKSKESEVIKSYYKTGDLSVEQQYRKGIFHGKNTYYYIDGKVMSIDRYENGSRHGISELYYENGKLKMESLYYQGTKHGEEKGYYINGKLKVVSSWHYGNQHGWKIKYNVDGSIDFKTYYWDDSEY